MEEASSGVLTAAVEMAVVAAEEEVKVVASTAAGRVVVALEKVAERARLTSSVG